MAWRLANSLTTFRNQVNKHAPSRNKASDGTIGDAAHQKSGSASDHNPWVKDGGMGVVTALDITNDPASGIDVHAIADHLRHMRDPRIKYVISNSRIFSSTVSPWVWRKYTGSNPHVKHFHLSVNSSKAHYDDAKEWDLRFAGGNHTPAEKPRPTLKRGDRGAEVATVQRLLMLELIDGIFGSETEREVMEFQQAEGLIPDGVVGKLTWIALDSIEQLPRPLKHQAPELLSSPEGDDNIDF